MPEHGRVRHLQQAREVMRELLLFARFLIVFAVVLVAEALA